MTNEDIIRMANEARLCACKWVDDDDDRDVESLYDFANLVAEAEREECAKAAEAVVPRHTECGNKIAGAIRARSNHD